MSAISDTYNELGTAIAAALPQHKELVNPYFPELNDELTFEKAFGVAFGSATNPEYIIGCGFSMQRDFEVVLTRKVFAGAQMRNADALTKRKDAEKAIFEDQILIQKALLNDITLGQAIIAVEYQSDSGLEIATNGKNDLLVLRSIFTVKYIENI